MSYLSQGGGGGGGRGVFIEGGKYFAIKNPMTKNIEELLICGLLGDGTGTLDCLINKSRNKERQGKRFRFAGTEEGFTPISNSEYVNSLEIWNEEEALQQRYNKEEKEKRRKTSEFFQSQLNQRVSESMAGIEEAALHSLKKSEGNKSFVINLIVNSLLSDEEIVESLKMKLKEYLQNIRGLKEPTFTLERKEFRSEDPKMQKFYTRSLGTLNIFSVSVTIDWS